MMERQSRPDRSLLERELREAQNRLRKLEEGLSEPTSHETASQAQKLESLSVLASGIAQDFNNLLVGILAHAGLALRALGSSSPADHLTARESIEQVEAAALEAADLTKKLLAFSGKAKLTVQPLDLAHLLNETRPALRRSVDPKLELEFNLTSQLPLISGDPAQIRQVITHLLSNAVDAIGPRASGRIAIGTGIVEFEEGEADQDLLPEPLAAGRYIYVTVGDDGVGMDEATLAQIFDPFFTTKSSGQGLGLAAVLGIVQGHRGALQVASQPGQGTTFKVYFPCLPSTAPVLRPQVEDDTSATASILVVDDDPTVRKVTRKILAAAGYGVVTAGDGVEALARLHERGGEISAVILDMRMPRMGGIETFDEMRRLFPNLPILMSSGYDPHDDAGYPLGSGPVGFLHKPYSPAELTDKLKELADPLAGRQG